ncbi:hypothetical protein ACFVH0_31110 [Streptomyces sp. NPDC127117]|uniref:hypothetical protein n=1 Tax=Streptomyces sp. NPDC127117 TaxID=3345368 RepID=UPI003629E90A
MAPLIAVAACLAASACSMNGKTSGETVGEQKKATSVTMQEAAERQDGMLDATMKAIAPALHWAHGATTTGNCDVTRRRVVMTIVSEERRGNLLGMVQRSWEKRGYTIKSVNNSHKFPAIFAVTSDGFGISVSVGGEGQFTFSADSPCVKKSEVAAPSASPNGPDYNHPIPRPNVNDPFWSSNEPIPTGSPRRS